MSNQPRVDGSQWTVRENGVDGPPKVAEPSAHAVTFHVCHTGYTCDTVIRQILKESSFQPITPDSRSCGAVRQDRNEIALLDARVAPPRGPHLRAAAPALARHELQDDDRCQELHHADAGESDRGGTGAGVPARPEERC